MSDNTSMDDLMLETSVAAEMIGVPARTLIRMADNGKVPCTRTPGGPGGAGHRRFRTKDILALRESGAEEIDRANLAFTEEQIADSYSTPKTQEILGLSYNTVRKYELEGILESHRLPVPASPVRYTKESVRALARTLARKRKKAKK